MSKFSTSPLLIACLAFILRCSMKRAGGKMTRVQAKTALSLGAVVICGITIAIVAVRASPAWRSPAQPAHEAPLVPVVVAKAQREDVPIYATGVGAMQAYQSVLVRARVDGTLMRFPVREGQEVKQGDVIAIIDPRPYKAALDQATAKKAQDEAQLANARLDLARFKSLSTQDFASRQQVDTQQALVNQ